MVAPATTIRVSGLGRDELAALRKGARKLGLSAEGYARQLIADGLLLEKRARTTSFDDLLAGVQAKFAASGMSERTLDKLVDQARTRYHLRSSKRKR